MTCASSRLRGPIGETPRIGEAYFAYLLPNGSASVFLKPVAHEDGSLSLLSSGRQFGDPGFYMVLRKDEDTVWAKYVSTMKESIHVTRTIGATCAPTTSSASGARGF